MINSHFDRKLGIVIHTGKEKITIEELLQATCHWLTSSDFRPQTPMIWDIQAAFVGISIEEMRQLVSLMIGFTKQKQFGKVGWVHPWALTRSMIDIVMDEFGWSDQSATFEIFDDAVLWYMHS